MTHNIKIILSTLIAIFLLSCFIKQSRMKDEPMSDEKEFTLNSIQCEEQKIILSYTLYNNSQSCHSYVLPREDSLYDYPIYNVYLNLESGAKLHIVENNDGKYAKMKFEFIPNDLNSVVLAPGEVYRGRMNLDLDYKLSLDSLYSIEVVQNYRAFEDPILIYNNCSYQNFINPGVLYLK